MAETASGSSPPPRGRRGGLGATTTCSHRRSFLCWSCGDGCPGGGGGGWPEATAGAATPASPGSTKPRHDLIIGIVAKRRLCGRIYGAMRRKIQAWWVSCEPSISVFNIFTNVQLACSCPSAWIISKTARNASLDRIENCKKCELRPTHVRRLRQDRPQFLQTHPETEAP